MGPRGVLAGELVGVFSTPWRGLCSGLKATREGPVGLTKMLLSVFLNSASDESQATVNRARLLLSAHRPHYCCPTLRRLLRALSPGGGAVSEAPALRCLSSSMENAPRPPGRGTGGPWGSYGSWMLGEPQVLNSFRRSLSFMTDLFLLSSLGLKTRVSQVPSR